VACYERASGDASAAGSLAVFRVFLTTIAINGTSIGTIVLSG
jgi:hypothetical protein